jgi:isoleucyl-tRNA synthetase
LYDFDPNKDAVAFEKLQSIDQYILRQAVLLAEDLRKWYEEFAFHKIYHRVNNFCVVDLSKFYFDVLKDRLYIYAPASHERRAAQTVLWRLGEAFVRLLAPIMSFTSEEVWGYLPKVEGRLDSVHLAYFPNPEAILGAPESPDPKQTEEWTMLRAIREEVMKALEEARKGKQIGKGLEAQVTLTAADPAYAVLAKYKDQLRYLFIVSAVTLNQRAENGHGAVKIEVSRASGQKCERCWTYSTQVGEDAEYPTVCERCSAILRELE